MKYLELTGRYVETVYYELKDIEQISLEFAQEVFCNNESEMHYLGYKPLEMLITIYMKDNSIKTHQAMKYDIQFV